MHPVHDTPHTATPAGAAHLPEVPLVYNGPMSEVQPGRLKRGLYEWSAIAFGLLSLVCLVFWGVSASSSIADLAPFEARKGLVLETWGGAFCARSRTDETIKELGAWARSKSLDPPLVAKRELMVPGFQYRAIRLGAAVAGRDGSTHWAFEMSMLYPFAVLVILAAVCFYRLRVISRKPESRNPVSN